MKGIIISILFILTLYPHLCNAQEAENKTDTTLYRLKKISIASGVAYGGTLIYYYYLWYKDSPTSRFVWRNDNSSWLQMDKAGHSTTVYTFSEYSYNTLKWAGLNNNKAAIYGALVGLTNMTTVELFDGFHSKWGASWGDILANTSGALLFTTQQLVWEEQRIRLKFSYFPSDKYAPYNPKILGDKHIKRIVKDYNSQTYWLSTNLSAFTRYNKIPNWLNVAVGYSGRGLGTLPHLDINGNVLPDYIRSRQYYLSLDIDWQRISTNSKLLKTIFKLFSFVKIPFPALEYNRNDSFVWHWLYF